jgi:hypothetical protein
MKKTRPIKFDLVIRDLKTIMLKMQFDYFIRKFVNHDLQSIDLKRYLQILRSTRTSKSRAIAELDLVYKHIEAWNVFLTSSASHLVVLESDAIIPDEKRLLTFLDNLCDISNEDFVSLTWPFTYSQLGIAESKIEFDEKYTQIECLITNTTAGYILPRKLATRFVKMVREHKSERLLAIDWLMNQMFMRIQRLEGMNGKTIVPMNELVINGSLVGRYSSEIPG